MESTSSDSAKNSAAMENITVVSNISPPNEDSNDNNLVTVTLINQMPATTSDCDTLKRHVSTPPRVDLSRADLIRLLSYLEGELQARDVVIATLKAEKAKQMLYQAKYGRLGLNDPFSALQRDSDTCGSNDDFDEASVGRLYESQLAHLERLIAVQRRAHQRAKQVLAAAERRHARSVRELEQEKKRRAHDAAQGDDVCMMLEKERERLKQELENQKNDQSKVEKEMEKAKQSLNDEKERHKQIVMYLLQERRQLLVRLMEERQKAMKIQQQRMEKNVDGEIPASSKDSNVEKTGTELVRELEALRKQLDEERRETSSLKEVVRAQEEDLNLIRQMILAKSRQAASQQQSPTAGAARTPGPPNSSAKNETATISVSGPVAAMNSPNSLSTEARYQTTRPNAAISPSIPPAGQRPILQQHYASTEIGSTSPLAAPSIPQQRPIRLLTNPAYQQQQQPPPPAYYQTGSGAQANKTAAVVQPRGRPVPPPAPNHSSIAAAPTSATSATTSTYAAPRVIPIQYIGPTTAAGATASTSAVNHHPQHPPYVNVSPASGSRRPGPTSAPTQPTTTTTQGSMVSAARNYVSNVVSAVTNAATNSPLLGGGMSGTRRGQTTIASPTPSANVTSPLREQWSYAAQATSSGAQSSVNTHRAGVAASVYNSSQPSQPQSSQQQLPTGSVARKANPPPRPPASATNQQVSVDAPYGSDIEEPEIAQLQAVINSMAGVPFSNRLGNDPHGVRSLPSPRRPPQSPQPQLVSPPQMPSSTGSNGNSRTTTIASSGLRNRPPSPVSNVVMVQQRSAVPNGIIQATVSVVGGTGGPIGTKRTPTPVPSTRAPLPTSANGSPVPAVTRTSALGSSPTTSTNDCNPPGTQTSSTQGTLGRKVKAMSGLANKIQKRMVAGVVGQVTSRQQRSNGDSDGKEQNVRSTQV